MKLILILLYTFMTMVCWETRTRKPRSQNERVALKQIGVLMLTLMFVTGYYLVFWR